MAKGRVTGTFTGKGKLKGIELERRERRKATAKGKIKSKRGKKVKMGMSFKAGKKFGAKAGKVGFTPSKKFGAKTKTGRKAKVRRAPPA